MTQRSARVTTAPTIYMAGDDGEPEGSVFLAGGITNCPDWQRELIELLSVPEDGALPNWVLYNPRRPVFTLTDDTLAREQIVWEYVRLRRASIVSFWFPRESVCPITLYELGRATMDVHRPVVVGMHPEYPRRLDLEVQLQLVDIPRLGAQNSWLVAPSLSYSLEALALEVRKAMRAFVLRIRDGCVRPVLRDDLRD